MRRRPTQQGYSLVEALIAIAILSAVAAALAPSVYAAIRASVGVAEKASGAEEIRVGHDAIVQLFASMIIPQLDETVFDGAPHRIALFVIANMEQGAARAELRISNGRLYYIPPREPADSLPANPSSDILLLEGVQSFRFYGAPNLDSPHVWVDRWNAGAPPQIVELRFRDGAANPMSFKLESTAPLHCAFDQVSRQCR